MGGGKGQTTTQTQNVAQEINPKYDPYYQDLAKRAQQASNTVSNQPYQGQFVAQGTGAENQAITMLRNAGNQIIPQLNNYQGQAAAGAQNYVGAGGELASLGRATARGDYLNPNNPVLNQAIAAAVNPLRDTLNQNIQRMEATASAQGADGNSRVNTVRNRMLTDFTRNAGDVASTLVNNWVGRERGLQQNAGTLVAQGMGLENAPGQVVANSISPTVNTAQLIGRSGELERGMDTLGIQNALAQFQEQNTAPFRNLFPYAQLLGTVPVTTTTNSTGTMTQPGQSTMSGVLQGALGGASMGSMFGPWGAAIGGVGGGVLGAFQ